MYEWGCAMAIKVREIVPDTALVYVAALDLLGSSSRLGAWQVLFAQTPFWVVATV